MKPSLNKLYKIIKLEAERGYDNRAVMGGLERVPDHWMAEAQAEGVPDDLVQAVVTRLRDYPRLPAAARAEVLEGLLKRMQRVSGAPGETAPGRRPEQKGRPAPRPAEPAQAKKQPRPDNAFTGEPAPGKGKRTDEPASLPPSGIMVPMKPVTAPGAESSDETLEELEADLDAEQQPEPAALPPEEEPSPHRTQEAPPPPVALSALNSPTTVLAGVGKSHARTLAQLGMHTLGDMLYNFPRKHVDYSQLKPINRLKYGEEVTIIAVVQSVNVRPLRNGQLKLVEALVSDGSAAMRVNFFNQVFVAKRLRPGVQASFSGKVEQYLGRLVMNNPEYELLEQQNLSTNRIVPVYPLTANITARWLRTVMYQVIGYWAPRVPDPLPLDLRQEAGLMDLPGALYQAHFPASWDLLKAAQLRLAFDEIFLLQLGVLQQKRLWQASEARIFELEPGWLEAQQARLPYALTGAQQRALQDLLQDLAAGSPMNRLLQGDVGSGKTIVAALAMAAVCQSGAQAALMAPTSILAEQHSQNLIKFFAGQDGAGLQPDQIRLLLGATPEAEKRSIRQGLEDGTIKIVIGTHALIEDPITFQDLQLVVVDEQHRFGVEQRAALRRKGQNPHLLVMTATPIPRSLALTIYGDLDLTVMDEMPPGRLPVGTYTLSPRERERAYQLARREVGEGRQAFIIYPLVTESERSDLPAAVEEHARLQREIFPAFRLGLLHGRMRPEEKEAVMLLFRDGQLDILVATSVVEVGVDVPNASLMIIEGANHFGLSQLHQFRGRVGRGAAKSYCLLIPDTTDALENERLQVMSETNDGFVLAERDLAQRGPGDFLGTRQSGIPELQVASLADVRLIEKARNIAQSVFSRDPNLSLPEHQLIQANLERFWRSGRGDIS